MIREIVKPEGNTYLLHLPDELIGKTVEVIAFEIEEKQSPVTLNSNGELNGAIDLMMRRYDKYPKISHSDFKFDRDEANNYE